MRQQPRLCTRLGGSSWEPNVTQIWSVLELDAVRRRVVQVRTADSDIPTSLQDWQSLAGPECELRLEEELMAEVGDGLRAVLGAVGEERDAGDSAGQGGAVLESHASPATGRHLINKWLELSMRRVRKCEQNKAKCT